MIYLQTSINAENAIALLQFAQLYLANSTGNRLWEPFPETLRSVNIAKIPVITSPK